MHYKIKYSCAVLFTSGSYMLKLWVDCGYPQMSLAKVENCWLQDSYPIVSPNHNHTHQTCFRQANFACHCTPLITKQKTFCSTILIGVWEPVWTHFSRHLGLSNILQHNCALFCNVIILLHLIFWWISTWFCFRQYQNITSHIKKMIINFNIYSPHCLIV